MDRSDTRPQEIRFDGFYGGIGSVHDHNWLFLLAFAEWNGIAASIVTSLQQAGSNVGGGDGTSRGNTVLQLALNFANSAANNVSIWDPKMAVMWTLIALVSLLLGCYMIVTLIIAICSALMLIYAGIFVLGFGGSRWTSEMAISYYKAVIAAGLRLFTLNLLMNTAITLVSQCTTEI